MARRAFVRRIDVSRPFSGTGGLALGAISLVENFDFYSIEDRVHRLDSEIAVLDDVIAADRKMMLKKVNAANKIKPWVDPLTANERLRAAWQPNWTNYLFDWSEFKAKGIPAYQSAILRVYEIRYLQLRETWEKFPGAPKPVTPVGPLPPEPSFMPDIPWGWIGAATLLGVALYFSAPIALAAIAAK